MMLFVRRIFLFVCFVQLLQQSPLQAQNYQGLQQLVKLPAGKQTVKEVLKSLQQQRGNYRYMYDPAQIDALSINIPKGELHLSALLALMDQQLPLEVELKENIIAIRNSHDNNGSLAKTVGTVQGRVFNDQNESVPGVTISADRGAQITTSRVDGTYLLQLSEGAHSIQFSHLAFSNTKVDNVIVKGGKATVKDVMLSSASSNLKGVTIKGNAKRETIAALYNRQKNAAGLTDGISSEQIARTPDKNVGEVLKRISGVATVDNKYVVVRGMSERYNGAMLNGQLMPSTELNRKNFSFDIIPSNIIDNITVYKTITPDMSAEFGGGLVNVETKAIPTENFFTVNVGGSINDNTTGKPFLSLKLDKEYLGRPSDHRELFGKLDWKDLKSIRAQTAGRTQQDAGSFNFHYPLKKGDVMSNNWGVYQMNAHPSQNYQLSWGHVTNLGNGRQLGLMAALSYRNTLQTQDVESQRDQFIYNPSKVNGEDSIIYRGKQYGFATNIGWLGGIGYTTRKHKISVQTLYINTLDQQFILGKGMSGIGGGQAPRIGYYDNVQWTRLWQTQFKGEHSIGGKGIKIQWMGTYVQLDRQRPDNHYMNTPAPSDSITKDPYLMTGPPSSQGVDGAMRWWTRAYESDLNWDINTQIPFRFNIGNTVLTTTFKAGYAGWYKDRSFYVARSSTNGPPSDMPRPIPAFFDASNPDYRFSFDDFGDDFHRYAALHAVYGMFDHKLAGKLRLVWGVRAEYYNLNKVNSVLDTVIAHIGNANTYDLSSLYNREKNWKVFPSASLTYSLTNKMNLRASYAQSIIRPDLRELTFFREYDFELGGEYISNDPIVSTGIKHFDLRYEYYPGPGEILSLSVFYKKIDNPMEIYKDFNNNYYSLQNSHAAENRGIEAEVRKSLSFINLPVIRNFTLYANATRIFARVQKASSITYKEDPPGSNKMVLVQRIGAWENRPQQGASNYMINAGAYYDIKYVSVSLTYNYVSNRLFMPNQNFYISQYERPLEALDGQVAVRLLKDKMVVRANVSNLLNSYSLIYINNGDGEETSGEQRTTKQLMYQKGKDLIQHRLTPGRTYSFTLGYNF